MPRSESISKPTWLLMGWLAWSLVGISQVLSQQVQVRFPQSSSVPNTGNAWSPTASSGAPAFPPSNPSAPWPTAGSTAPLTAGPATVTPIGPPYTGGTAPYGATIRPNSSPLLPPMTGQPPPTANSWNVGNWLGTGTGYSQPTASTAPFGGYPAYPNSYPSTVYPNAAPPTLFPNGYGAPPPTSTMGGLYPSSVNPATSMSSSIFNANNWQMGTGWPTTDMNGPLMNGPMPLTSRFLVAPRFRHSWIAADDQSNGLGINDSDVSLLFQVPRFFGSTQPLYIAPSFSMHLWDGPKGSVADLPGSAYSAFLDFGWESDPLRTFGAELGVRVGVFTDFDTFNSESLRILGKILGRVRLTPTSTGRLGVYWIDRNRIKLVPAVGILCAPNADTRFDLFFPEPKLSHYLSTFGNTDMWWYASGYYGGGAWTVERASGGSDSIDINDWRVVFGLEWGRNELLRQGHRFAFFEGGYVFNRELIYRYRPQDSIDLENSFVLRGGFIY